MLRASWLAGEHAPKRALTALRPQLVEDAVAAHPAADRVIWLDVVDHTAVCTRAGEVMPGERRSLDAGAQWAPGDGVSNGISV
jgi:hypothetical protein